MILANPIGNPYIGPIPYTETDLDSKRFFGRADLQKLVKLNLQNSPLTIFYGMSGVGKSSLLRAGVASVLRQEAERNLQSGNPKFGIVVFRDWFDNPLEKLKCQIKKNIQQIDGIKCIDPLIEKEGWEENSEKKKTLKILAPDSTFPFVEYLRVWTKCLGGDNHGELYIILDQFEDYFSCQEDPHSRETFVNGFTRVIEEYDYSEIPVRFLVSIREDLLAKADRFFKGRISRWFDNRISLDQLTESEAIEAIEKPITEWYNKQVSSEQQFEIEDEFSKSIVEKIANDNDGKTIEAAYLQLVMRQLWEIEKDRPGSHILRTSTLGELRGTTRIIEQHLEARLKSLDAENDRRTVASIFRHLVTPSGTSISHNANDLFEYINDDQFLTHQKLDSSQFQELLGTLSEDSPSRILRPIGGNRYEVLFSAYAKVILNWLDDYKQEQEKFKLSRISTIAQRAISLAQKTSIYSQKCDHIQEHDGANDELIALLSLRAYFWNKESSLPILSRVDQALREALRIPYFSTLLEGHQREVVAVAFSADGQQLVAADINDKILHWDLRQFGSSPKKPGSEKKQPITLSVAIQNDDLKIVSYSNFLPDSGNDAKFGAEPQTLLSKYLEICTSASNPNQDTLAVEPRELKVYLSEVTIQIVYSTTDETARLDTDQDRNDCTVSAIASSRDNRILVAGYRDGTIHWQDLETGITLRSTHNQSTISAIAVSSDGKLFAIGSEDATIQLWHIESNCLSPTALLRGHQKKINCLAFNCNNSFLASGSEDTTVRLWEVRNDRTDYLEWEGHDGYPVRAVAFSPDMKWLASGGWDQTSLKHEENDTVRLWDLTKPHLSPIILPNSHYGNAPLAFSPDGKILASGGYNDDNKVRLWYLEQLQDFLEQSEGYLNQPQTLPAFLPGHGGEVRAIAFSPNGKWLASGGWNKTLILWDLDSLELFWEFEGFFESEVRTLAFSPDSKYLGSGSWTNRNSNQTICLWDIDQLLSVLDKVDLKQRPGRKIYPSDLAQLNPVIDLRGAHEQSEVFSVNFCPEKKKDIEAQTNKKVGYQLASVSEDKTLRLWDLIRDEGTVSIEINDPIILGGHNFKGSSIAYSPDGNMLAIGRWPETQTSSQPEGIWLWNLNEMSANPTVLPILLTVSTQVASKYKNVVSSVAFSPDGQFLASGSNDGKIRVWIAKTNSLAAMVRQKIRRDIREHEWKEYVHSSFPLENLPTSESSAINMVSTQDMLISAAKEHKTLPYFPDFSQRENLNSNQKRILEIFERRPADIISEADAISESGIVDSYLVLETLRLLGYLQISHTDNQPGTIKYKLSSEYQKHRYSHSINSVVDNLKHKDKKKHF